MSAAAEVQSPTTGDAAAREKARLVDHAVHTADADAATEPQQQHVEGQGKEAEEGAAVAPGERMAGAKVADLELGKLDGDGEEETGESPGHRRDGYEEMGSQMSVTPTYAKKQKTWRRFLNKGDMSNLFSFLLLVLTATLRYSLGGSGPGMTLLQYLMAAALFGLSGGVTNALAVNMLFDEYPLIYGSGIIPKRFKEIRHAVKSTIMRSFFDKEYLQNYMQHHATELLARADIPAKLRETMSSPDFDSLLTTKLTEMSQKPEGMMLQTMGQMFGGVPMMVPMIKPMLIGFGEEMGKHMAENFDIAEVISVDQVRTEIDRLMTEKMLLLTPEIVKHLMEDVIREHLGWLVVWGNVFGGLIGVISLAAGYGGG